MHTGLSPKDSPKQARQVKTQNLSPKRGNDREEVISPGMQKVKTSQVGSARRRPRTNAKSEVTVDSGAFKQKTKAMAKARTGNHSR